jgi:hypothetical protein
VLIISVFTLTTPRWSGLPSRRSVYSLSALEYRMIGILDYWGFKLRPSVADFKK